MEGERAERAFARIERSIARCAEIVNELLDITRDQPLDRHPTPVRRWLESAVRSIETALGTAVALDAPGPVAVVQTDRAVRRGEELTICYHDDEAALARKWGIMV